jgi:hypothetical protein
MLHVLFQNIPFSVLNNEYKYFHVDTMLLARRFDSKSAMPYVLPAITVIVLAVALAVPGLLGNGPDGPAITGLAASTGPGEAVIDNYTGNAGGVEVVGGRVDAQIRLSAPMHQVMPADSVIGVQITGASADVASVERKSSMGIEEFIRLSGKPFKREEGRLYAINYTGPGYVGQNHTVGLSQFNGLDRLLPAGQYMLRTEVMYQGVIITSRERLFDVSYDI